MLCKAAARASSGLGSCQHPRAADVSGQYPFEVRRCGVLLVSSKVGKAGSPKLGSDSVSVHAVIHRCSSTETVKRVSSKKIFGLYNT